MDKHNTMDLKCKIGEECGSTVSTTSEKLAVNLCGGVKIQGTNCPTATRNFCPAKTPWNDDKIQSLEKDPEMCYL